MPETLPIQEIHFLGGPVSFSVQISRPHLLLVGGVRQDQGGDGGADLPKLLLGGGHVKLPELPKNITREKRVIRDNFFYTDTGCFFLMFRPKKYKITYRVFFLISPPRIC